MEYPRATGGSERFTGPNAVRAGFFHPCFFEEWCAGGAPDEKKMVR